jgi:hypothetical protein
MVYAWSNEQSIVTAEALQGVCDDGLYIAGTLRSEESDNS